MMTLQQSFSRTRGLWVLRPAGSSLSSRYLSSGQNQNVNDTNDKVPKLKEAQSYEKWLSNMNTVKKDARFRLDTYKDALINWRKGQNAPDEWYAERVSFWMKRYEKFVGLTEVKAAQALVVKEERHFIDSQDQRRDTQTAINEVQNKLKSLRAELERTPRGEDKYLELITEEHAIIKNENAITEQLQNLERLEREKFSRLTTAVRDSHEKERAQAEKTKYWSVLGTVIGTCLGIIGTTVNNRMRMRELRQIVTDSTKSHPSGVVTAAGAGSAAVTTASSGAVIAASVIQDQQEQLEQLSENFLQVSAGLDSKMNSIEKAIGNLFHYQKNNSSSTSKPVAASSQSSAPKNDPKELQDMQKAVENQKKSFDKSFIDLQNNLFRHNSALIESLGKTISARDEKYLQALKQTNTSAYDSFYARVYEIDEKVKDIRSLVVSQAIPDHNSTINSNELVNQNEKTAKALERSNRSIAGTVEISLKEHEARIKSQIFFTGIMMALVTPAIVYAVNRLI
jgi:hypothetical protein